MSKVVYKYNLNFRKDLRHTTHRLPKDFKIVTVGIDRNGDRCIWIQHSIPHEGIDPSELQTEQFQIVNTGEPHEDCWVPVGTIFQLPFIRHVLQFRRS